MTDNSKTTEPKQHQSALAALLAAQPNFSGVKKDAENTHFKNKYSTLKALLDAVLPAMHGQGLVLTQPVIGTEVGYFVRTTLSHPASGTEITTDIPLIMSRQDMQQFKAASTYARRIGLENISGVSAGDDDDAETNRKDANPIGGALTDAWRQSVEDGIPENATPIQRAKAYAESICEDFKGKGEKALQNRWNKHRSLIATFEQRFPELHSQVVDAYENEMMRATNNDVGYAAQ